MIPYELVKMIHEGRLREAEMKRKRWQIAKERRGTPADPAVPTFKKRLMVHLSGLLLSIGIRI